MPSIRRRGETLQDHQALDIIDQPEPAAPVVVNSGTPGVESPVADLPPDLLNAPVGLDDDLSHALAARPPRRKLPGVTAFLGAAVLISGGFLSGVLVQKHQGGSSSGAGGGNAAALAAAFGRTRTGTGTGTGATGATGTGTTGTGATAGGAAGGAGGAGAGSTVGTVKLVDGSTVYVTTTDGSIVKVTTSKSTTIKVTKNGTAQDLAPGTAVVVQGTAGADGVVTATSVTQGGGAGGFGGFGGRTRTGTGTGGAGAPPTAGG